MARKKSVKKAARQFAYHVDELDGFCDSAIASGLSDQQITWMVEAAVIKLYAEFEPLVLQALLGAINEV
ncbi:MAG: hypothetical protein ACC726_12055 [Chloroflexota bacterium]